MAATSCLTVEVGGMVSSFAEEVDSVGILEESTFPEGLSSRTWKHYSFIISMRKDAAD
jgi:hypothetical protein